MLSAAGGAAGIAGAVWAVAWLESTLPPNMLPVPDIGIDTTVLLVALATTFVTGIVFGLAPAWQAAKTEVNATLKDAGRSATGGGARPLVRKSLAGAELALATILLVGAALLVRSLLELQRVPLGFDPRESPRSTGAAPRIYADRVKGVNSYRDLMATLKGMGIKNAGLSSGIPFGAAPSTWRLGPLLRPHAVQRHPR